MGIFKDFLREVTANYSASDSRVIVSAMRTAERLMRPRVRYNNDPFVHHSLGVARIVAHKMGLGPSAVVAALLHDVARENMMTMPDVIAKYGAMVGEILRGMNSISSVDAKISTLQADNFRDLIISYSTDPRVLLIKIADRLEVMRSLAAFPELKRNKKSWETLHLYAPLAHKLGLYTIKTELEDLSLKYLEETEYRAIEQKLKESQAERMAFIAEFTRPIEEKLNAIGLTYKIKSRTKSIYSIWRKMKKQKVPFEGVYDIFAIRVIVDCPQEIEKMQCWTVFSVVTDFYTPNPDRMRDWISIPKSNGYESLHATVLASTLPLGGTKEAPRWVEVQIRSARMDDVAERGVAAHWRYKELSAGAISSEAWLERLRSIVDSSASDLPLGEEFDFSVSSSEVFVFTPTGDLRKLPEGATVLDFAFDIHSLVGASCTGALVNGHAVPIKERLRSGDVVEIKSSKNQRAKVDWLNFVVTNKAKSKIRQILREELASSATLGKEELERKIRNWRLPLTMEEAVTLLCKLYKVKTGIEVYDIIAEGRASMIEIKDHLTRYVQEGLPINEPKARKAPTSTTSHAGANDALVIDNSVHGLDYKMAGCCNPIFGDLIFGFVTIHSGITIHRQGCPNASRLREQYPYRVMEARWREEAAATSGAFLASIKVEGTDSQGIASQITDLITQKLGVNIRTVNFSAIGGSFTGLVVVEVKNTLMVDMIIHSLCKVKGVERAARQN
ncbi:MAG: RelA/SpoT family protein [Mucinivorans sp.]